MIGLARPSAATRLALSVQLRVRLGLLEWILPGWRGRLAVAAFAGQFGRFRTARSVAVVRPELAVTPFELDMTKRI